MEVRLACRCGETLRSAGARVVLTIGFYKHSAPLEPEHSLVAAEAALSNLRIRVLRNGVRMIPSNVNPSKGHPVRVRIAEKDDVETIVTVINAAFRVAEGFFVNRERIDVESVRHFLDTGKFLLAESEGLLIGCVYVEPQQDRAYLGLLAVDPGRQQAGLGSKLMDAAEDYCRKLSCRYMDIKIVNLREQLPDFYRRRGYVETGTSPFPADIETQLPCHFIDMSKAL